MFFMFSLRGRGTICLEDLHQSQTYSNFATQLSGSMAIYFSISSLEAGMEMPCLWANSEISDADSAGPLQSIACLLVEAMHVHTE